MNSSIVTYLSNIIDKGNICSINQVESTEKPLISGKIQKIFPLSKRNCEPSDVLMMHLKEVYNEEGSSRWPFKVVFVDYAASFFNNLDLNKGDQLAFTDVKLVRDSSYKRNFGDFYRSRVVVGIWNMNSIQNVYYRRKGEVEWNNIPNFLMSASLPDPPNGVLYSEDNNNHSDDDQSIIPLEPIIERAKPPPLPVEVRKEINRSPFKNQVVSNSAVNKEINNEIVCDLYHYTKLSQVQKNTKVNSYGIILRILKKPTLTGNKKYHLMINIIDETKTDEFFVHVFGNSIDDFPQLKPYNIIRLHRLQIEERDSKLDGRVFHSRDLLVFDKNDPTIVYRTSKKFSLTEFDKKRVDELREWMFENITAARPYSTLSSLVMTNRKINLIGQITDIKIFDDHPALALRISDGTKCKIPFFRLSFDANNWTKVLMESKVCHTESEEIDIMVSEPHKNFKTLKIGDRIELYNVETLEKKEIVRTQAISHLKLCMKGVWDNLKLLSIPNHANSAEPSTSKQIPLTSPMESSDRENIRKRKLFNPDSLLDFDSDPMREDDNLGNMIQDENHIEMDQNIPPKQSNRSQNVSMESNPEQNISPKHLNPEQVVSRKLDFLRNVSKQLDPQDVEPNALSTKQSNPPDVPQQLNSLRDSSPEQSEEWVTRWPKNDGNDVFTIKARLITTLPRITGNSEDDDLMLLVNYYCDECLRFFSFDKVAFNDEELICPQCLLENHKGELKVLLKMEVLLSDEHNDHVWGILLSEYSEKYFGCTVQQFLSSKEIRLRVKTLIVSDLGNIDNKVFLLVKIRPIRNFYHYHVIDIKRHRL